MQYVPIDEKHPLKAVSPYGATKLMIEDILRDVSASDPEWRIILLRYFNPVGAHPSGGWGGAVVGGREGEGFWAWGEAGTQGWLAGLRGKPVSKRRSIAALLGVND